MWLRGVEENRKATEREWREIEKQLGLPDLPKL